MNPVQYIIMDPSVPMSEGKARAQAAHAAVEGVRISAKEPHGNPWDETLVNLWQRGGHYAKIVLQADNLLAAEHYIADRGFKTALIIDEGRTELPSLTLTAVGTQIVDKDNAHVRETFSAFKLYKSKPDIIVVETNYRMTPEKLDLVKWLVQEGHTEEATRVAREKPTNTGGRIGTSSGRFGDWLRERFSL